MKNGWNSWCFKAPQCLLSSNPYNEQGKQRNQDCWKLTECKLLINACSYSWPSAVNIFVFIATSYSIAIIWAGIMNPQMERKKTSFCGSRRWSVPSVWGDGDALCYLSRHCKGGPIQAELPCTLLITRTLFSPSAAENESHPPRQRVNICRNARKNQSSDPGSREGRAIRHH